MTRTDGTILLGLPVPPIVGPTLVWVAVALLSVPGCGPPAAKLVPAEGTRSITEYWKSGFYRIAEAADVPIVCAFVDMQTRTGGFGPVVRPSGDLSADMDVMREFYADKTGIKPGRFGPVRLREEGDSTDVEGDT